MKIQALLIALAVLIAGCSPSDSGSSSQPAQVAAAAETTSDIPRTPSGKPDLNGIWQVLMNANDNLEPAPPQAAYQLVPGHLGELRRLVPSRLDY